MARPDTQNAPTLAWLVDVGGDLSVAALRCLSAGLSKSATAAAGFVGHQTDALQEATADWLDLNLVDQGSAA
ncbi:hypothetical protein ACRBEV_27685 [Methylobacterium phyllosphaerae]